MKFVKGNLINKVALENNLSIHPNSACHNFTISFNELKIENGELKIFDVMGRELYGTQFVNRNSYIVNQSLVSGVYFVKVSDGEKVFQQKLVVEQSAH